MISFFEDLLAIEVGEYGFTLSTAWLYVSISWELLILTALILLSRKAWKWWHNR